MYSRYKNFSQGFTLIELMVVVTIMTILTSVILMSQSKYTDGINVRNAADTLSLTLRQAQVYGISVKELQPGSNDFSNAYGVAFDRGTTGAYAFFADTASDGTYEGGFSNCSGSGCIEITTLSGGNTISDLCVISTTGVESCGSGAGFNKLDITFKRPDTQAHIKLSGVDLTNTQQAVRIKLTSRQGETHSVTVYKTGQITTQ